MKRIAREILINEQKLPSVEDFKDGNKSGISSDDIPSTQSTTDLGRSLRPCKLFLFECRCGVAYIRKITYYWKQEKKKLN